MFSLRTNGVAVCVPKRERNSFLRAHFSPLDVLSDRAIRMRYRLPREEIQCIVTIVAPHIRRRSNCNYALSPEVQSLAALHYYAAGSFMDVVGDGTGLSKASVSVSRSVSAVNNVLLRQARAHIQTASTRAVRDDLEYVRSFKPNSENVEQIKVLFYGPVGVGKSSLISSIASIMKEKCVFCASANANTTDKSFTTKFEIHKMLKNDGGDFHPFVLCDIMGLEEGAKSGVHVEDIKLAIKGHMKNKYECNPTSPLSEESPFYNKSPEQDERVHVVVCVLSAEPMEIAPSILNKINETRQMISDLGVPQVLILTKIELFCEVTENSLRNVYHSKYLERKINYISSATGFPLNNILPVKNYSKEIKFNDDMNALILRALRMILDFGDDFVNKM